MREYFIALCQGEHLENMATNIISSYIFETFIGRCCIIMVRIPDSLGINAGFVALFRGTPALLMSNSISAK